MDAVERGAPETLDGVIDWYIAFCALDNFGTLISNDGCRLGDGFALVRAFLEGEGPSDRRPSGSGDDCGAWRDGVGATMAIVGAAGVGDDTRRR